ncbi:carbonic anhydrase [filamentous cyanobacterium LEGE 11480]|uniref:Carbonic anhydrase n=1 Tax=Romeriopsis navalis LEGE 11480 TaxID=2777977 RepID=A0A928Z753_9CYAN|nr:carbonic anhydrase [Romeriopsis navalis]MBE9032870.1 carbonic anhydrase [Romeriopsis navalis LEGE 11480]
MRKLITGIREFQSSYYQEKRELFEQLGHGQSPRVLFITCSDSRIDPNLILQAEPGELFVIRNAGNIIPPYGSANGGEGASMEYALQALDIDQIIICGHNHCGAMKGLLKLNKLQEDLPLVYDWLKHTEATRRILKDCYQGYEGDELIEIAVAENILTQIDNLETYPIVRSRMQQGRLHIYGWLYEIESGEVQAYNPATEQFELPQSQLYPEDMGDQQEIKPGRFVKSSAPLVKAVEAPQPTNAYQPTPLGTNWLSAEQSNRIYRGSNRSR